jgi:hypothetical protein
LHSDIVLLNQEVQTMKKLFLIVAVLIAAASIPTPLFERRCMTCGQVIHRESLIEHVAYFAPVEWQHLYCLQNTSQLAVFQAPPQQPTP